MEGTRGREAARGRCCGNCRELAEVGLGLGVALIVRCGYGTARSK